MYQKEALDALALPAAFGLRAAAADPGGFARLGSASAYVERIRHLQQTRSLRGRGIAG